MPGHAACFLANLLLIPALHALDLAGITVHRCGDGPIIDARTPGWSTPADARNINGPTLVRMPDWASGRLGRWHLYFADHHGDHLRLAWADRPEGPWRIHGPGLLPLAEAGFDDHVASPEIVIDHVGRRILCFYHGQSLRPQRVHATRVAASIDGRTFAAPSPIIAPFYLRVWRQDGLWYGLAKAGAGLQLLRARDPFQPWEPGPELLPRARHACVWPVAGGQLVIYSRIGDEPEHLRLALLPTTATDWRDWPVAMEPCRPLLLPERPYEGADRPSAPSRSGAASGRVRQLRDPHVVADGDRLLLTYAVAGESGIALAEIRGVPRPTPEAAR